MKTRISEATDGRRLLHVEDRLQSPDADAPIVCVTFELHIPSDWSIKAGTQGLIHLSTVRTDTFEPIALDRSQFREIMGQAIRTAADFDPDW